MSEWQIGRDADGNAAVIKARGEDFPFLTFGRVDQHTERRARQIAAAPDLLGVLVSIMDDRMVEHMPQDIKARAFDAIRAALPATRDMEASNG